MFSGANSAAARSARAIIGWLPSLCRTLAWLLFILVPRPAARINALMGLFTAFLQKIDRESAPRAAASGLLLRRPLAAARGTDFSRIFAGACRGRGNPAPAINVKYRFAELFRRVAH